MGNVKISPAILTPIMERMLRPVLRLCLKNSLKLGEILEMLKRVLVDVAREDLQQRGEEVSLSRLSIMTGVHRKDVTRLERSEERSKPCDNVIARIMAQWQLHRGFSTKSGKPRALEAEGRESEFSSLVNSVTGGDLGAYPILFEMQRLGVIEKRGTKVKLVWRDYVDNEDETYGLSMLSDDINDLVEAVDQNLTHKPDVANLHLKTVFDNCTQESAPKIKRWLLNEGSKFHSKVRRYCSQFDRDLNGQSNKPGGVKVAFGSFSLLSGEKV